MTHTPAVSVLMSMKNAQPYLEQAVLSILNQSFANFEFVIVDNASTDGSADCVERMARCDRRIALLRNEADLGHSGGLNRGLEACRAEWIARMDADDIALPNRFERQIDFLREHPAVRTTSCLAHYIDTHGKRVGRTVAELTTQADFDRVVAANLPIGILHPGAMIARQVLVEAGGYRPAYDPANDIDLWCRISDRHLILVQPEYLMEYRIHADSLSAQSYEFARSKHLWARDSMIARRAGDPEPAWEEFLEGRRNAPWAVRLNRWRKIQAKRLYRQSAQHHVASRRMRSLLEIGLAALLQPEYTIPRLKGQVLHADRR